MKLHRPLHPEHPREYDASSGKCHASRPVDLRQRAPKPHWSKTRNSPANFFLKRISLGWSQRRERRGFSITTGRPSGSTASKNVHIDVAILLPSSTSRLSEGERFGKPKRFSPSSLILGLGGRSRTLDHVEHAIASHTPRHLAGSPCLHPLAANRRLCWARLPCSTRLASHFIFCGSARSAFSLKSVSQAEPSMPLRASAWLMPAVPA